MPGHATQQQTAKHSVAPDRRQASDRDQAPQAPARAEAESSGAPAGPTDEPAASRAAVPPEVDALHDYINDKLLDPLANAERSLVTETYDWEKFNAMEYAGQTGGNLFMASSEQDVQAWVTGAATTVIGLALGKAVEAGATMAGAALGTALMPGVGTAIGALVGFLVGMAAHFLFGATNDQALGAQMVEDAFKAMEQKFMTELDPKRDEATKAVNASQAEEKARVRAVTDLDDLRERAARYEAETAQAVDAAARMAARGESDRSIARKMLRIWVRQHARDDHEGRYDRNIEGTQLTEEQWERQTGLVPASDRAHSAWKSIGDPALFTHQLDLEWARAGLSRSWNQKVREEINADLLRSGRRSKEKYGGRWYDEPLRQDPSRLKKWLRYHDGDFTLGFSEGDIEALEKDVRYGWIKIRTYLNLEGFAGRFGADGTCYVDSVTWEVYSPSIEDQHRLGTRRFEQQFE